MVAKTLFEHFINDDDTYTGEDYRKYRKELATFVLEIAAYPVQGRA